MSGSRTYPLWRIYAHLRGLAIVGVLVNHAAYLGMTYHLGWLPGLPGPAPRLLPEKAVYLALIGIQELSRVAVPLFIFLAGTFLVQASLTIAGIWGRSRKLLYPFLVWSLVGWGMNWLLFPVVIRGWGVGDYLVNLVTGQAQLGYFFTPLILQYFLLGRWLVPALRRRPVPVLLTALAIQLAAMLWNYLTLFDFAWFGREVDPPVPEWFFPRFLFYFVLGIWAGQAPSRLKSLLQHRRWGLGILAGLGGVLLLTESRLVYHLLHHYGVRFDPILVSSSLNPWKITTAFWSIAAILAAVMVGLHRLPRSDILRRLGTVAFPLYILQGPAFLGMMKIPYLYSLPSSLFTLFLFLGGVVLPLAAIFLVRRHLPRARAVVLGD